MIKDIDARYKKSFRPVYGLYIFCYIAVLCVWMLFGFWWFGVDWDGLSPEKNLVFHKIKYIVVLSFMLLTPLFHELFLGKFTKTEEILRETEQALNKIPKKDRAEVVRWLHRYGGFPPNALQTYALVLIFAILLWEMWFLDCWVGAGRALVWEPDWVKAVCGWMAQHTGLAGEKPWFVFELPEELQSHQVFDEPTLAHASNEFWQKKKLEYSHEAAFLASPQGRAVLLFHAWRALTYPVVCVCFGMVFGWKQGQEILNPCHSRSAGRWIFIILTSPFMLLFLLFPLMMLQDIDGTSFPAVMFPLAWFQGVKMYLAGMMFFFLAWTVLSGWTVFWWRVLKRVVRRITGL